MVVQTSDCLVVMLVASKGLVLVAKTVDYSAGMKDELLVAEMDICLAG